MAIAQLMSKTTQRATRRASSPRKGKLGCEVCEGWSHISILFQVQKSFSWISEAVQSGESAKTSMCKAAEHTKMDTALYEIVRAVLNN